MTQGQRFSEIYSRLLELYPDSECSLDNRQDPWRLLVGAILATQCTDKRVNQVTPALFDAYPDVFAMAGATVEQVLPYVKTCGMSNRKPHSLVFSASSLLVRRLMFRFSWQIAILLRQPPRSLTPP